MKAKRQIVFDEWNTYAAERDERLMFISFDVGAADDPPADLQYCARVQVPIQSPNPAGGPVSPEAEKLWDMEDQLVEMLQKHRVHCRLVARLTYEGLREIVFQLDDFDTFRPPVGMWMEENSDYEIDVSEHEGWEFFEEYISPRTEDYIYMADCSVVQHLIEAGSDPDKEHALEYAFSGEPEGLEKVAEALKHRGYEPSDDFDVQSGQIVMIKRMALELEEIVQQSVANYELATDEGVEFSGWGAAIVE